VSRPWLDGLDPVFRLPKLGIEAIAFPGHGPKIGEDGPLTFVSKALQICKTGRKGHLGQQLCLFIGQWGCKRGLKHLLRSLTFFFHGGQSRPALVFLDYQAALLFLRDAGCLDRMICHPFGDGPPLCFLCFLILLPAGKLRPPRFLLFPPGGLFSLLGGSPFVSFPYKRRKKPNEKTKWSEEYR
jgi:hypothetical protein